jgi:hypothetical protein
MGPMLVNTKQKIAVLAVGLVVATTGFVTDEASVAAPPARPAVASAARQSAVTMRETSGGGAPQTIGSKR